MRLTQILDRVLTLARAIEAYQQERSPRKALTFRTYREGDKLDPPPPQAQELRDFLNGLSPAAVYLVAAIMYLGRGDLRPQDLLEEYTSLSDTFAKPARMVEQMLRKPLAWYLSEGLEKLAEAGIDVDRLFGA